MKLIAKFKSTTDADSASMQLSSMGIVTHVSQRGTKNLGLPIDGLVDAGLWAVLDYQFDDAVKFINDNNHVITTGLSEEELIQFNKSAGDTVFKSLNRAIMYGVGIIILLLIAMYYMGMLK